MKTLIFALMFMLLLSCEKKKAITIIEGNKRIEQQQTKQNVVITKDVYDNILSFRPAIQDIAFYFLTNKEDFSADNYCFKCNKFELWIANDYDSANMYSPKIGLNEKERRFFWQLYNDYRYKDKRYFKYEDNITITVK